VAGVHAVEVELLHVDWRGVWEHTVVSVAGWWARVLVSVISRKRVLYISWEEHAALEAGRARLERRKSSIEWLLEGVGRVHEPRPGEGVGPHAPKQVVLGVPAQQDGRRRGGLDGGVDGREG